MRSVDAENGGRALRTTARVEILDEKVSTLLPDSAYAPSKWWMACGIFLVVLSIYVLTGPGRIDSIDGQARFDVAYNWIVNGRPTINDPWIRGFMGIPGRDGFRYSYYGAPGSVFAIPLVWLGIHYNAPAIQLSHFLFSLVSPIFGAGIAPILFLLYLELGVTVRKALAWTMVSSFATYLWPISTSVLDNAQHAFFAFAAVYCGFMSARRKSMPYAVTGGLMGGVLVLYQPYFLLIAPALGVSVLAWKRCPALKRSTKQESIVARVASGAQRGLHGPVTLLREAWAGPGESRSSCIRYFMFFAGVSVGVMLTLAYNHLRFGSWLDDGKVRSAAQLKYSLFGNPLAGVLTLLISPGKSVLLYSPPLLIGILGIRQLRRRTPELAVTIGAVSLCLVLFISCVAFAGGDWCWGPRYLTPLLPLWALAFPFTVGFKVRRDLAVAVIGVGFLVQALALTVENQRFFFERGLNDYFWAEDPWFYFKHSALFARLSETASLNQGLPPTAQWFNSIPEPGLTTYAILGPPPNIPRRLAPTWIRNFQIYFLPRPWPLWMAWLRPSMRPVNMLAWLVGLLGMTGLGTLLIWSMLKTSLRGWPAQSWTLRGSLNRIPLDEIPSEMVVKSEAPAATDDC